MNSEAGEIHPALLLWLKAAELTVAIDLDRQVQAYRDWRNRLTVFDKVDVVTLIETERGGGAQPTSSVVFKRLCSAPLETARRARDEHKPHASTALRLN